MAQYIDKSALVAEIEKYISNYKGILNKVDKSSDDWVESTLILDSKIDVLQHLLHFFDTLEVKEVNLKKEVCKYVQKHFTIDKEQLDRFGIKEKDYMYSMDKSDILLIAKHFFELGIKAKGE